MRECILNLPISEQERIAKEAGYLSLEAFQEDIKSSLKVTQKALEQWENMPPLTEAEKAAKIKSVKENPDAIEFYKRVYGNDTTVEDVIEMIKAS